MDKGDGRTLGQAILPRILRTWGLDPEIGTRSVLVTSSRWIVIKDLWASGLLGRIHFCAE